jgi:hypothetical protein
MKQKTKKHLLSLCLLLSAATFQSHAQRADYMYLHSPGGGEQSFLLDDVRKITLTEQSMQVHPFSGASTSVFYDNIAKLTFTQQEGNAIDAPLKEDVRVYFNPVEDRLIIESPSPIAAVNLYNMQGVLVQRTAPQSLSAGISLSSCPAGVYVVQVSNGQGIKVRKIIKN